MHAGPSGHPVPTLIVPPVYRTARTIETGKNIVVCSDGTGNADVQGRGSNVFKLFEAVDTAGHLYDISLPRQIAFYDEGVGTSSWKPLKALGGAIGVGLGRNVRELYMEVARAYNPGKGDRLYLFGFSRGAFTARMLAGLIGEYGIPDGQAPEGELRGAVERAYDYYLRRKEMPLGVVRFHAAPIEFVGVWDTVDAVGLPLPSVAAAINRVFPFKRDVRDLPSAVRFGCHALALDDQRKSFTPVLWTDDDRVEQVWFAGAHSNVGGGYARQGVSLIPLHWMMERAEARGLRFVKSDALYYDEHQIVADKVHDSRAGLGRYYRWLPRDVRALSAGARVAHPHVHISVFDRIAQGVSSYAPINVPADPVITFTEARDRQFLAPTDVHAVLQRYRGELDAEARRIGPAIRLGVASYWIFVVGSVLLLAGLGRLFPETTTIGTVLAFLLSPLALVLGAAGRLIDLVAPSLGGDAVRIGRTTLVLGLALLVLAYRLSAATDRRLDGTFVQLWHRIRPDLLGALTRSPSPSVIPATAPTSAPGGTAVTTGGISSPS